MGIPSKIENILNRLYNEIGQISLQAQEVNGKILPFLLRKYKSWVYLVKIENIFNRLKINLLRGPGSEG